MMFRIVRQERRRPAGIFEEPASGRRSGEANSTAAILLETFVGSSRLKRTTQ